MNDSFTTACTTNESLTQMQYAAYNLCHSCILFRLLCIRIRTNTHKSICTDSFIPLCMSVCLCECIVTVKQWQFIKSTAYQLRYHKKWQHAERWREFTIVVCTGLRVFIFTIRTLLVTVTELVIRNTLRPITQAIHWIVLITPGCLWLRRGVYDGMW